jgi:prophage tail gpP-like protein
MTQQVPQQTIVGSPASIGASVDTPELGSIAIRFPNVFIGGKPLRFLNFLSYEYKQDFLSPSDEWSFDLAEDQLSDLEKAAIVPRTVVQVAIDDVVQSIGILDDIDASGSSKGGTIWKLTGRDWMSPAVDSHVDPNVRFKPTMTLEDLATAVFAPFGMKVLAADNIANRNAITGRVYGTPTSKKGKPLKSYILHEIKPYTAESAYNFVARVSQRFGLWVWPGDDGETVILGKPDFDQPARYQLRHKQTGDTSQNNVEDGWSLTISAKDQPSVILASGFGGGGDFAHSSLRSGVINPLIDADLSSIIDAYPSVKFVNPPDALSAVQPLTDPHPRPMFLYDSESHTQAELDAFVLRELSLRTRKSLEASYPILGHRINGQPVCVDTIIDVDDDRANFHGPLWVQGRHFSKRKGEGTKTVITMIRPGTLTF